MCGMMCSQLCALSQHASDEVLNMSQGAVESGIVPACKQHGGARMSQGAIDISIT